MWETKHPILRVCVAPVQGREPESEVESLRAQNAQLRGLVQRGLDSRRRMMDRHRAEADREADFLGEGLAHMEALTVENAALRAEVERLRGRESDALVAMQGLAVQRGISLDAATEEITFLRAEVERLRSTAARMTAAASEAIVTRDRAVFERDEARELLRDGVKYVVEDGAVTPRATRLARWVDRVREALGEDGGK